MGFVFICSTQAEAGLDANKGRQLIKPIIIFFKLVFTCLSPQILIAIIEYFWIRALDWHRW